MKKKALKKMTSKQDIKELDISGFAILAVVGFIVMFFFGSLFISLVPSGNVGILKQWGRARDEYLTPGIHFKVPFRDSIENYNTQIQKMRGDADSASSDMQQIITTYVLTYRIPNEQAVQMFVSVGQHDRVADRLINGAVQERVKMETAKFTAKELLENRYLIKERVYQGLKDTLEKRGLIVEELFIENFKFDGEYMEAIKAKQVAEQNAQKAERELQQFMIEQQRKVEQAKAEAESKILAEQGKANATRINAEATAYATLTKAEAEAEAKKLVRAQLDPLYVEYVIASRWKGELPTFWGSEMMPIMDFRMLNTTG